MGRWSGALAPLLVDYAGVREGERVLDVGCGTGAIAAAVLAAAPSARMTGIDPAEAYIARAQTRLGNDEVTFDVGDAQNLRFADASFDRTVSMLVINFIPDPTSALAEMTRVTRRGGTVSAAVWDYGEGMEMLRRFWDAVRAVRPSDEDRDERHMPLCRRGELGALWRSHGLRTVSEDALTIETRFSAFEDYWAPFALKQGPAGRYLAGLGADDREQIARQLRERLVGDRPDGPLVLSARAWAVRGVVP